MSYQVLARKWRPKNFEEVAGQEHIIRALKNALTQQRLHHAYLFSGTRGVGKTSIARILAKCLNCETGVTATPCGKCDACTEIDAGRFIDLIEVDAASRTKVEDTRDLLDNVQYLPTKGQYKIYIIDEVHMLSGHSFNALLKTLEEPPAHVKFLLATTDPQKLPVTVLSRCLQFNLKTLSPELLKKQLRHILTQEKIPHEDEALHQIAIGANGSVRDALSLLDQAIAFGQNKVTTADVKTMMGTIDSQKVFALLEALAANNVDSILKIISDLAELAPDFISTINELLEILHKISLVQLAPNINTNNWLYQDLIQQLASKITPEETQLFYQIALIGKRDLPLAPSLRLGFEMVMLRMLAFRPEVVSPLTINVCNKNPTNTDRNVSPTPISKDETTNHNDKQPSDIAAPKTVTSDNSNLLLKLEVTGPTLALLQHCIVTKITENEVEIMLEPNQAPLLNKKQEERINAALSKHFNSPMAAIIKLGTANMETSANIKKRENSRKQNEALQTIEKDQGIKELMSKFDAKIIANSVKSE
ncbi:MAG: DNA polymerase III subunit gamma/tau [Gammaproteobacteria bacterium]|nr:DNA polymerase III subunit gamma/tau [Gammaproteobacteria bacterium]